MNDATQTSSGRPIGARVEERTSPPGRRRRTYEEAIDAAADVLIACDIACAAMTPREQAEAAWTPTSTRTVDELEQIIRADRAGVRRDVDWPRAEVTPPRRSDGA